MYMCGTEHVRWRMLQYSRLCGSCRDDSMDRPRVLTRKSQKRTVRYVRPSPLALEQCKKRVVLSRCVAVGAMCVTCYYDSTCCMVWLVYWNGSREPRYLRRYLYHSVGTGW